MQNRVMLSGDSGENATKTVSRSIISKKTTLPVQHTFFVHFFGVVLHDYNEKLAEPS